MAFGNTSELPDSQIEYRDPDGGRRWVSLIIYIVLALVVATLVVLAGRWLYHQVSNNSGPAPTTIAPQGTKSGNKAPATKTPAPAPSSSNPGGSASTPAPSPTSSNSTSNGKTTPAPQPTTLPNNGPGEDIALFVGVTFVAATLHFLAAMRRTSRSA